eukprot:CAMPEP_0117073424 /NCGR_PEP_ID=MMETSP0472-20121206/51713_1 /TAXON_ID=693140 ORGANISM="Tiarina fusus, Strain LIS" /NCGR_SAMPLE_ID=MMETSP0472 /ASSEMBLY_ACC=CAM_ASM_000603 /LENGTH=60 /DNA_ID=CAMNT_0004797997 /DNA_START=312 /DNA_END=494 /DNA_ORIENTATION=+
MMLPVLLRRALFKEPRLSSELLEFIPADRMLPVGRFLRHAWRKLFLNDFWNFWMEFCRFI